jgi:hypothetical protein
MAIRNGHASVAEILVLFGAYPEVILSIAGPVWTRRDIRPRIASFVARIWHTSPIHKASYENDVDKLQELLNTRSQSTSLSLPEFLETRDEHGWTALHVAVFMNRIDVTKLLVSEGADILATTRYRGHTALHLACSRGCTQIIRWILELF